jgi:hypothetical protein
MTTLLAKSSLFITKLFHEIFLLLEETRKTNGLGVGKFIYLQSLSDLVIIYSANNSLTTESTFRRGLQSDIVPESFKIHPEGAIKN